MLVDISSLSPRERYRLMIQAIVPRPIAWVLSESGPDNYNLAPFSYFTGVSSAPPLLMLSIGPKPSKEEKDTLANIEARKHFVVHIPHSAQVEQVTESSRTLPHGESELPKAGVETVPFDSFSLPRVKGCRVALGCKHFQTVRLPGVAQSIVFGEMLMAHLDDAVSQMGDPNQAPIIDVKQLDPLARLGNNDYAELGKSMTVPLATE